MIRLALGAKFELRQLKLRLLQKNIFEFIFSFLGYVVKNVHVHVAIMSTIWNTHMSISGWKLEILT